jgi:hypothetical protein
VRALQLAHFAHLLVQVEFSQSHPAFEAGGPAVAAAAGLAFHSAGSAFEAVCASRAISPRQAGPRLVHLERKETSEILVHFREGGRLEGLGDDLRHGGEATARFWLSMVGRALSGVHLKFTA